MATFTLPIRHPATATATATAKVHRAFQLRHVVPKAGMALSHVASILGNSTRDKEVMDALLTSVQTNEVKNKRLLRAELAQVFLSMTDSVLRGDLTFFKGHKQAFFAHFYKGIPDHAWPKRLKPTSFFRLIDTLVEARCAYVAAPRNDGGEKDADMALQKAIDVCVKVMAEAMGEFMDFGFTWSIWGHDYDNLDSSDAGSEVEGEEEEEEDDDDDERDEGEGEGTGAIKADDMQVDEECQAGLVGVEAQMVDNDMMNLD